MSFLFNKTPTMTNNEPIKDIFYSFPIGLIIIDKETYFSSSSRILFANNYSRKILGIPKDNDISSFTNTLSLYKRYDSSDKEEITLKDSIFKFKEKFSKNVFISPLKELIYVKIKHHHKKILVVVDDLQEERQMLHSKFVKNIGYEYLLTLYHEINNPLNSLIASVHEIIQKIDSITGISKRIDLLVCLIQFFLKNFIVYFQVSIIDKKEAENNTTFNLDSILKQMSNKYAMLFDYKKIKYRNSNFAFLNGKSSTMNYFYFKSLIKSIFSYFYHKIDKGGRFYVSVEKIDNSKLKLFFSNTKNSEALTKSFSSLSDHEKYKDTSKQKNTIQTIEMMIEMMNKLSNLLGLQLEHFDSESTYISLIIPYENQSKLISIEELTELSPTHHTVFQKINRSMPKFSIDDLNKYICTPNLTEEKEEIINKKNSKRFESIIKSKKKDLMKSLLKNIDKIDHTNESPRNSQSVQEYHKYHLYDSSNNSSHLSNISNCNDDTNKDINSHYLKRNNVDLIKGKRKKQLSFSRTTLEMISPKIKCPNSLKYYSILRDQNKNCDIEESDKEDGTEIDKTAFRAIRSSTINNPPLQPANKKMIYGKKSILREGERLSLANIRNITEEDLEIESKSNNISFSKVIFQNFIKERILYPPNKKKNTVPVQGFYADIGTRTKKINNRYLNNDVSTPENCIRSLFNCKCNDVLVVDDEQFNLSCLTNLLNTFNVSSDIASNGKECLDQITLKTNRKCKCNKSYYKLILLDILMPKINGIEAAKEIIKRVSTGVIPNTTSIIFISACLDQETIVKDLNKESPIVKEFISKPIKRSKIEDLLQKYYNIEHLM